jgi:hypothetical protein
LFSTTADTFKATASTCTTLENYSLSFRFNFYFKKSLYWVSYTVDLHLYSHVTNLETSELSRWTIFPWQLSLRKDFRCTFLITGWINFDSAVTNSGWWPTWRTISSVISLFESSTCFEQLCADPQDDNCINTTSGIITLKTIEWSKITKIARTYRNLIVYKTLTINDKILFKYNVF